MQVFTKEQTAQIPCACSWPQYEAARDRITIVRHPIVADAVRKLRDVNTPTEEFVKYSQRASTLLILAATADLPLDEVRIETPTQTFTPSEKLTSDRVTFCVVFRAGMVFFLDRDLLPKSPVATYDITRDEETSLPQPLRGDLPDDISERRTLLTEPMLATGGTTTCVIRDLYAAGAREITLVCFFTAVQGVLRITGQFPNVRIVTAALDPGLNEKNYIVPGCGDFGDRLMGTVKKITRLQGPAFNTRPFQRPAH